MSSHITAAQREILDRVLRTQLTALRQSVATARQGLTRRDHASAELEQDPHDLPQQAGDFEVEAGLSELDAKQYAALTDALQRLRGSAYGRCIDCGVDIPFDRLIAEPQTERCLACRSALEHEHETASLG
jgi:DnaK suppressor protein